MSRAPRPSPEAPAYMTYADGYDWYAARRSGGYSERVKCENEQVARAQLRAWRKAARTGATR